MSGMVPSLIRGLDDDGRISYFVRLKRDETNLFFVWCGDIESGISYALRLCHPAPHTSSAPCPAPCASSGPHPRLLHWSSATHIRGGVRTHRVRPHDEDEDEAAGGRKESSGEESTSEDEGRPLRPKKWDTESFFL